MNIALMAGGLAALLAAADTPVTTMEATGTVAPDQDGCLDHTVRELGMSAKRQGQERRWVIGPQFLHPSVVQGGSLGVKMEKGEKGTTVRVAASWPGAAKPPEVQSELQDRITLMVSKMVQLCGVPQPVVTCTLAPAGGKAAPCPAR